MSPFAINDLQCLIDQLHGNPSPEFIEDVRDRIILAVMSAGPGVLAGLLEKALDGAVEQRKRTAALQ